MKQLLALTIALCTVVLLPAQTTRGTLALGFHSYTPASNQSLIAPSNSLGIGFGTTKGENAAGMVVDETSYFTIGLSGSVHYFLVDNLSLGVNLSFLNQKTTDKDTDNTGTLSLFLAGPELRYYIPVGARARVFLRGQAAFGTTNYKSDNAGSNFDFESTGTISQFGGGAGLALFLRPNFSLDLGAGYNFFGSKETYTDPFLGEEVKSESTNGGAVIDLGFTFFFGSQAGE